MQTFTFIQVQRGSWGSMILNKTKQVKAETPWEAVAILDAKYGPYKYLRNGDKVSWELVQPEVDEDEGTVYDNEMDA